MKSDVIHISNGGAGISEAIRQTEAVAVYKSLSKKDAVRLVHLTEEMTGMLTALTGEHEADFWLETVDDTFYLHLKTETKMNTELRKRLLAASTSGENIAAKGVMGKIKDLFSRLLEPSEAPMPETEAETTPDEPISADAEPESPKEENPQDQPAADESAEPASETETNPEV